MNGFIVINKEAGYTSRDVVNIACKILKTKKIGHTGTLDPMATGVLVLAIGKATKLVDYITNKEKEYIAEIELGTLTDTLDITGNLLASETVRKDEAEIDFVLKQMIGTYLQEVPIYSAVKVKGKKLYEYARHHEVVTLPKKEVTIKSLERISPLSTSQGKIRFTIQTTVSKGTYIRCLIRDLAIQLGTVGTMCQLERTRQGCYTLDVASTLSEFESGHYHYISIPEALSDVKQVVPSDEHEVRIRNGNKIEACYDVDTVLFITPEGSPIGLYEEYEPGHFKPRIMF